jgi:hypothetical protein
VRRSFFTQIAAAVRFLAQPIRDAFADADPPVLIDYRFRIADSWYNRWLEYKPPGAALS